MVTIRMKKIGSSILDLQKNWNKLLEILDFKHLKNTKSLLDYLNIFYIPLKISVLAKSVFITIEALVEAAELAQKKL